MNFILQFVDGPGGIFDYNGYLILALPPLTIEGSDLVGHAQCDFPVDNFDGMSEKFVAVAMPAADMRPISRLYAENRGMDSEANLFDFPELGYQFAKYEIEREAKKINAFATWGSCQ